MNTAIYWTCTHGLWVCAINSRLGQLHMYERGREKLIQLLEIRPFLCRGIDSNDGD